MRALVFLLACTACTGSFVLSLIFNKINSLALMTSFSRGFFLIGCAFAWLVAVDIADLFFHTSFLFQGLYRPLVVRSLLTLALWYLVIECLRQRKNIGENERGIER